MPMELHDFNGLVDRFHIHFLGIDAPDFHQGFSPCTGSYGNYGSTAFPFSNSIEDVSEALEEAFNGLVAQLQFENINVDYDKLELVMDQEKKLFMEDPDFRDTFESWKTVESVSDEEDENENEDEDEDLVAVAGGNLYIYVGVCLRVCSDCNGYGFTIEELSGGHKDEKECEMCNGKG